MNLRRYGTMFGVLLCGFLLSFAAGQAPEKARADLSAPGEDHKELDVLAGAWDVTDAIRQRLTPAQWREDLQFAVDTFLERDRSFSPEARQRFREVIANLQKTVETRADEQIIVELSKAVALSKNAHTRLTFCVIVVNSAAVQSESGGSLTGPMLSEQHRSTPNFSARRCSESVGAPLKLSSNLLTRCLRAMLLGSTI